MIGLRPALVLLAVLALSGSVARATSSSETRDAPVPSLEPAKTAAEWRALTREQPRGRAAQAACRPLRAVFYAASDWLRLATKLRASGSPCAEYYISVPPIVADKTTFRRDQARRIRALGPNFHALAEVHFTTWNRWVASTGSSWHTAGVTARQRMAEAGYDVALGDSWMLNELNSAVRRGDGNARANVREFLRGLYEGDGRRPTKGAVLVIGFGQRTSNVSVYQSTLQAWLADSAFWTDMSTYVADWSQEVYGDLRAHAVPGSPTLVRREYLNDYLQHHLVLAGAGPPEIETARAYLREAYSPLANGAWPRESAWGWTMVPAEQMAAYLSAQVDALRAFSTAAGQARDHWGFAWAPSNTTGMPAGDFAAQTGSLLDRLAAAVRDSGAVDPESPGSGACGADESLCAVDLADARHNEAWRSFRAWAQSILSLGPVSPISLVAGVASGPLELSVSSAVTRPVSVTLRSSSAGGAFSTSPVGPWTATLSLSVVPGAPVAYYHRDTRAGTATVSASSPGISPGTRPVSVAAGAAARVTVTPGPRSLRARGETRFTGTAVDAFGNPTASPLSWTVSPGELGTFVRGSGGTVRFRAGRVVGSGTVSARAGSLLGSATVVVRAATLRVRALEVRSTARGALVTLATVDGARRPVSLANITLVARLDGRRVARAQRPTGAAGKARLQLTLGRGCVSLAVTRAHAEGFRWDGRSPRIRLCRR
ncbi:MAG TPA: hypothetical protein VFG70_05345 [Gaiellaceae bacterium]|nr:hypothetical protein [Gaiellaceae bacterium]